jgi:Ca-activated chloride channel homolog
MKTKWFVLMMVFAGIFAPSIKCAEKSIEQFNIMLLLDASSHAKARWEGKTKLLHIREALGQAMAELNKSPSWGLNMGLRVFGDKTPREKNDCVDYRLAAKLDWFEPGLINSFIEGVTPKGKNCFSKAIASTKEDFQTSVSNNRNFVVSLVSARDECTQDEKAAFEYLVKEAGLEAAFVIGVNLAQKDQDYFNAIFKSIPGHFINSSSPDALVQNLIKILTENCQENSVSESEKDVEPAKSEDANISEKTNS